MIWRKKVNLAYQRTPCRLSNMEVVQWCSGAASLQVAQENWSQLKEWWNPMFTPIFWKKTSRHWQEIFVLEDSGVFQSDNNPIDKSKSTTALLQRKQVNVLQWPSMSPDVSPIKNLWQQLKVKINSWTPKSLKVLKRATIKEWSTIPQETTWNLVKNYKKMLLSAIQMKSHDINYK